MAAQEKNYASGFVNTTDKQTYYYRDDEAHKAIEELQNGGGGGGIIECEQTVESIADGGENVFTFTKSDGTTAELKVRNGRKGTPGDAGTVSDVSTTGTGDIVTGVELDPDTKALKVKKEKTLPTTLPANGGNADTVDGYHFVVGSAAGSAANTIYFVV